jgi:hypothetical protein
MHTISTRERRWAKERGDDVEDGSLLSLHKRIARRVKGR